MKSKPMVNNSDKWLSIAKDAATKAGSFLKKYNKTAKDIKSDFKKDIKIKADFKAESIIVGCLREKTNFSILSEEKGLLKGRNEDYLWVVDPLDGTLNFMRDIPLSCVSIGLWRKDVPLLGVVYEFNNSELFLGIARDSAWLNNKPIKVSKIHKKEKAVLCTGFPANTNFSLPSIQKFIGSIRQYKKIRLLGSAAISLAYVASGRTDAYYEENIMFWDIGGAIPILLGAGGRVRMKEGTLTNSFNVFASNGYFECGKG